MAEKVGDLYYDVTLETADAVRRSRDMQRENARTGGSFDALTPKITAVVRAISLYAAALTLIKAVRTADEVRLLGSRIEVAAGSAEKGAAALAELQRISARTQTDVAANAGVFNRLNQSLLQMGGTQQDTLRITELLGKAIKVSGATGVEASSAMTQFGQALGSGKLAGDELRSLLENAPYLMRQLADGIGVPIGALKQLGEEGKLTADVVVNALSKAAEKIDADFGKLPSTFEGAMAAASDAAARANEALDTLTGTSAALTGATRGVGQVFDLLAEQFRAATTDGDKLGRSDTVRTWAENTTLALSYVVDAADFVVRGFRQIGTAIGGAAAAAGAAARGEFSQARTILAEMGRDVVAIGSGPLSGARMRAQIEATAAARRAEDRGFTPSVPGSQLRPPPGSGDGDKKKRGKFDALAYLEGLREGTLEGEEKIAAAEREAMRKAAEMLKERKLTYEQYAEAIKLIQQQAAQERLDIQVKEADDLRDAMRRADEANIEAEKKAADERARGQSFARGVIGAADPVAAVLFEAEEKSLILREAAARDLENAQLYAAAQIALEQETQRKLDEIRQRDLDLQAAAQQQTVALYAQTAADIYAVLAQAGKERTALAKAAFLASKALAVAEIVMNTNVAASKAYAQFGAYGAPVAEAIRVSGYASAGIVAGQAIADTFGGGRQYGGPVSAGSLYRVNESGRPEMFTAANGSQYMLPTASGSVTPADEVGGVGVHWTINVSNAPPGTTATVNERDRTIEIAVARAEARVADGIAEHRGPVWSAMRGSTNVRSAQ